VYPNAEHASGQDDFASMQKPLLQFFALTGMRSPFDCLQSQNQFPQSSVVLHVTVVAPEGLLDPGGVLAGGFAPGGVGVEDPELPELPPPPEEEELDPSDEQAKRKRPKPMIT
jgi:hypothetical protein